MTTTMTRPARGPALRFPLQPVIDLTRAESYEQLGIRLGVSGDAVRQWSVRGLSSKQADFVATKLGYYPLSIWENFNDDLDVEFDDLDEDVETDHLDALWEHFANEDESTAALRAHIWELLHPTPSAMRETATGGMTKGFRIRLGPGLWN